MTAPRTTLFAALRRTHFHSTTFALLVAALALAVVAFFSLRAQLAANLDLVARTIAYASEAAVMFADDTTTGEILTQVAEREHLVEATITAADGSELARYERRADATLDHFGAAVGRLLLPDRITADITHEQRLLGEVSLRGDGAVFVGFFLKTLAVLLASIALAMFAARGMARRMERRIVSQLDALASLAHATRLNKDFECRLPAFEVAEFDELGKDFNALLGEIQMRNTELVARQVSLEEANASLSHLALHDSLTGLANRARFGECLALALIDARRNGGRVGLLYLDNDRFKEINDRHGHAAGDALLVEVARRIRGAIRDTDLVARLGGDEFTVLLAPLRDTADAVRVAEKILAVMARPIRLKADAIVVPGVSIGIATYPEHADDGEALLRAADHAMYHAKRDGRGHYRLYAAAAGIPPGEHP